MRRTVRLTGRRQLPKSCVNIRLIDVGVKQAAELIIKSHQFFEDFPADARIKIRLFENKQVEILDFGKRAKLKNYVEISTTTFGNPSCQLRVVSTKEDSLGLLLGSTNTWRLKSSENGIDGTARGILYFQPMDIAPRAWRLEIQENAHPIVQIDRRIPDPGTWARNDPVFLAGVLPAVIELIFLDILDHPEPSETEWMNDWLDWAERVVPGQVPPQFDEEKEGKRAWVDALIDSFCSRHSLSDRILKELIPDGRSF